MSAPEREPDPLATDDDAPRAVPTYAPETVLTLDEAAAACGISTRLLKESGAPISFAFGERRPRVVWGALVTWIAKKVA